MSHRIFFTVIMLFQVSTLWATSAQRWNHEQIQVEDGLPESTVYSVVQDQAGFVWFGTTSGLARYDGYDLKTLVHDGADDNTLSNNNAGNLFIDSRNTLWVGTFGGGVNAVDINNNRIIRYPYTSKQTENMISENVQTFHEAPDGTLWIGTGTGLYQFQNNQFNHFDPHETDQDKLTHTRVWDIHDADDGALWVATSNGLYWFDTREKTFEHHPLPPELVIDISSNQFRTLHTAMGKVWIGSSSGLYQFNPQDQSFRYFSDQSVAMKINDIEEVNEGFLMIASMAGLHQFDLSNEQFVFETEGLLWQAFAHADIRDVFIDDAGLMWLASRDSGVFKVDTTGGLFTYHYDLIPNTDGSEKAEQLWTFTATDDSQLLLGTSDTILLRTGDQQYQRIGTTDDAELDGIIRDLQPSMQGGYWAAGSAGLHHLNPQTMIAEAVTAPFDLVGIEPTDIFSVLETAEGNLWLALYNIGVLRWYPAENRAELLQEFDGRPLMDLNLTNLSEDNRGRIWVSSNLVGLIMYDQAANQWRIFSHDFNDKSSISSNRIKDIYQDQSGQIWIGTARGLNRFDDATQSFFRYDTESGLLDNNINIILEDSTSNIWLGHRFGLSKLNKKTGQIKTFVFNQSIRKDGAVTHSGYISQDDVIYLGSANGYYQFDPKDVIKQSDYQPKLSLTDVRINKLPLSGMGLTIAQSAFQMKHDDQTIDFGFAVLDYKTPEQIQYMYRLNGLHDDWLDVTDTRSIELKSLKPGNYQLEIKAKNNDGSWPEKQLQLSLMVKPAWWDRLWVQSLFVLLLAVLAFAAHFRRTRVIRKQNLLLESEVSKRTEELQELNEQLAIAANTDYLTGLPNRMSFISELNDIMSDQKTHGHIVLADVDHFKQINDQYGHNAGDDILQQVAQTLEQLLPAHGCLARWGGEEFIIFLRQTDSNQAHQQVEAIRAGIDQHQFSHQDEVIHVTITLGIAPLTVEQDLITSINAADEALYEGKTSGRNKVVSHP